MKDDTGGKQADTSLDQGTRLAFERTFLAHERTQMAWVRTSLTLISFGFGIAKFYHYLHAQQPERGPLLSSRHIGTLMILIGLLALALASIQHGQSLKTLRAHCPGLRPSLAWVLSALLSVIGALALLVIWLEE
jgi:putative membrane protein